MDDGKLLELLEFYQDMTEKQNELIFRMSRILKRQAEDLTNLRQMLGDEEDTGQRMDRQIEEELLKDYFNCMEP